MSLLISKLVKDGKHTPIDLFSQEMARTFPNRDLHRSIEGFHRILATNIYKTKDNRYYHVHGIYNSPTTLRLYKDYLTISLYQGA